MARNYNSLLKFAAVCSFLGALTTFLLIFLPNPAASDFESQALLFQNKQYLTKLWLLFVHPQLNFIASLGIAVILFKKYPLRILLGVLFLFVWAYSEIAQQALLIDTLNQIWRPAYLEAPSETIKIMFETLIRGASGISDSKYFLVIYGFGIGTLCYGFAFFQEGGRAKWLGLALVFIGVLSLCSFLRYYLGMSSLDGLVNWVYKYIYPYLQPLVRIAMGLWLLNEVKTRIISENA